MQTSERLLILLRRIDTKATLTNCVQVLVENVTKVATYRDCNIFLVCHRFQSRDCLPCWNTSMWSLSLKYFIHTSVSESLRGPHVPDHLCFVFVCFVFFLQGSNEVWEVENDKKTDVLWQVDMFMFHMNLFEINNIEAMIMYIMILRMIW